MFEKDRPRQSEVRHRKVRIDAKEGDAVCLVDWKGIVHELLPPGKTIESDLYYLMRLKRSIQEKRPELINRKGIIFHRDNIRPHTFLTRQKLRKFRWEVLMHLPYSPNLTVRLPFVSVFVELP